MPEQPINDELEPVDHSDVPRLVSLAWDGELSGRDMRRLAQHIQECSRCAWATQRMRAFLRKLAPFLEDRED